MDARGTLVCRGADDFLPSPGSVMRSIPRAMWYLTSILVAFLILGPTLEPGVARRTQTGISKFVLNLISTLDSPSEVEESAIDRMMQRIRSGAIRLDLSPTTEDLERSEPVPVGLACSALSGKSSQFDRRPGWPSDFPHLTDLILMAVLKDRPGCYDFLMERVGVLRVCYHGKGYELDLKRERRRLWSNIL